MKFIIARNRDGGFDVMERKTIGEIEVYEKVVSTATSEDAERIRVALHTTEGRDQ